MHQILISIYADITDQPLTGIRLEKGGEWPRRWGFLDAAEVIMSPFYSTRRRVDTSYDAIVSVRV